MGRIVNLDTSLAPEPVEGYSFTDYAGDIITVRQSGMKIDIFDGSDFQTDIEPRDLDKWIEALQRMKELLEDDGEF